MWTKFSALLIYEILVQLRAQIFRLFEEQYKRKPAFLSVFNMIHNYRNINSSMKVCAIETHIFIASFYLLLLDIGVHNAPKSLHYFGCGISYLFGRSV